MNTCNNRENISGRDATEEPDKNLVWTGGVGAGGAQRRISDS